MSEGPALITVLEFCKRLGISNWTWYRHAFRSRLMSMQIYPVKVGAKERWPAKAVPEAVDLLRER